MNSSQSLSYSITALLVLILIYQQAAASNISVLVKLIDASSTKIIKSTPQQISDLNHTIKVVNRTLKHSYGNVSDEKAVQLFLEELKNLHNSGSLTIKDYEDYQRLAAIKSFLATQALKTTKTLLD